LLVTLGGVDSARAASIRRRIGDRFGWMLVVETDRRDGSAFDVIEVRSSREPASTKLWPKWRSRDTADDLLRFLRAFS
jgi:hypothetical protein